MEFDYIRLSCHEDGSAVQPASPPPVVGMWKFPAGAASNHFRFAWSQLAAADDGERTWIAIPRLSDSSLSIRTTTPTKLEFNGLSGWKSVVTWTLIPST